MFKRFARLPFFKTALEDYEPKALFAFFLLGIAEISLLAVPYYLKAFVPRLNEYLHISDIDLQQLISLIGWLALIFLIPGGFIADRFNPRLSCAISMMVGSLFSFA